MEIIALAEAIIPRAVIDGNVLLHLPRAIIPRAIIPLMTELFWAIILRVIIPWAGIISRGIIIRKRIVPVFLHNSGMED